MDLNFEIVTAGEMEKARTARLKIRLQGHQSAVESARAHIARREAEIPELEKALQDAKEHYSGILNDVEDHLSACGLGGNGAAGPPHTGLSRAAATYSLHRKTGRQNATQKVAVCQRVPFRIEMPAAPSGTAVFRG